MGERTRGWFDRPRHPYSRLRVSRLQTTGMRSRTGGSVATTGVNRQDGRARRLPLVASNLQADGGNLVSATVEPLLQEWQQLPEFRSRRVAVHQQAPGGPLDGPGPDGRTQG